MTTNLLLQAVPSFYYCAETRLVLYPTLPSPTLLYGMKISFSRCLFLALSAQQHSSTVLTSHNHSAALDFSRAHCPTQKHLLRPLNKCIPIIFILEFKHQCTSNINLVQQQSQIVFSSQTLSDPWMVLSVTLHYFTSALWYRYTD